MSSHCDDELVQLYVEGGLEPVGRAGVVGLTGLARFLQRRVSGR